MDALADTLSGIILPRINASVSRQGFSPGKPGDISNFCDQLRPIGRADSIHAHHGFVFGQGRGQPVHFGPEFLDMLRCEIQLLDAVLYQLLVDRFLGKDSNEFFGTVKKLLRLVFLEVITVAFAESLVALGERFDAGFPDAVNVPKGVSIVDPLLGSIELHRAAEEFINARISLVKKRDQVVFSSHPLLHEEVELTVQSFQLSTSIVHARILTKFGPVVKSISGDFRGVGRIGLHLAERIVPIVFDQVRIDGTDEDPGIRQGMKDRFMVSPGTFQDSPGITFQGTNVLCETVEIVFCQ